jgi:hypothetical protein
MDAQVHSKLDVIRASHADLAIPEQKGRHVGAPRN